MSALNKAFLPQENYSELVVQFLADLMRATAEVSNPDTFQQALQTYCYDLKPWLDPSDGPPQPRAVISLLEHCEFDETGEQIVVILSPEAEALFRAWLRRNKVLNERGFNTAHAWSN
jgi:hypothetical protein